MAIILKTGNIKNTYEIVSELNRGAFANSYEAKTAKGERVFFKQYKSPSPTVEWYKSFVEHQKEIKKRITSDPAARDRCYRFIEFFEEREFYQVFEFIEGGHSLTSCIKEPTKFTWAQWVVFAKVMMFGIKALHEVKIIHSDLKPDNIILIPDKSIGMGYKLRIIDLDWALFANQEAPWHGKQGYIGTPDYLSPEHIQGKTPTIESDIYTCGIMLSEILGNGHPFQDTLGENYNDAATHGRYKPISLRKPIERVTDQKFLEVILNACLNPNPSLRPTASQLCDALIGKKFIWHIDGSIIKPPTKTIPLKTSQPKTSRPSTKAKKVGIFFNGNEIYSIGTDSEIGKQQLKNTHEDAKFFSNPQFRLIKKASIWYIHRCETATNETIVNSIKLVEPIIINDGMIVAVGNSSKGIEKLPLTLKLLND